MLSIEFDIIFLICKIEFSLFFLPFLQKMKTKSLLFNDTYSNLTLFFLISRDLA